MTTRLLPALALTGLLHLSSPALAQDAPPNAHPGPVHTSLDTIQPSDVEAYVDLVFSDRNKGAYRPRDGKVHKFVEPLNITLVWPECKQIGHDAVYRFKEITGLPVSYSFEHPNGLPISIAIFGINEMDDLYLSKEWYSWIKEFVAQGKNNLFEELSNDIKTTSIVDRYDVDDKNRSRIAIAFITNNHT